MYRKFVFLTSYEIRNTKNGRFSFSVCYTKIETRFSVPFFAFLSNAKNENEMCIAFSMYIVNTKIETRCAKNEFS